VVAVVFAKGELSSQLEMLLSSQGDAKFTT
jgi:hypothetical protein